MKREEIKNLSYLLLTLINLNSMEKENIQKEIENNQKSDLPNKVIVIKENIKEDDFFYN